jgi:hypothetical protein
VKIALMGLTLIAALSISSYAAAQFYNPESEYGACQEDALRGVHYPVEGDCPNWDARKANHVKTQTPPQRHVYPGSRRRKQLEQ